MKRVLSLLLLLMCLWVVSATSTSAQVYLHYSVNQPPALSANAGNDQLICIGNPATLGGNPSAQGGYGGYSYSWTPNVSLSGTTVPNPTATPSQDVTYFLTATDSLGCLAVDTVVITVDTCVGIGLTASVHNFDVFPNPNEGKFTLSVNLASELEWLRLSVVDMNGREVYAKTLSQPTRMLREQVSLDGLSRGTYFVRLEAPGIQLSRKMMLR